MRACVQVRADYIELAVHHTTQLDAARSGLATIAMLLNAFELSAQNVVEPYWTQVRRRRLILHHRLQ